MEYRDGDYFDNESTYLFDDVGYNKVFESKVHFEKGRWWTNESLKFNATSLPCQKITNP